MNRTDIRKATTRTHDGKWSTWLTLEEENARILFRWVFPFLALGVKVAEYDPPSVYLVNHVVDGVHYSL